MENTHFKAIQISESADKQYIRSMIQRQISDLPAGEVLVRVHYSALNYKDALSSVGNKGVTRNYPHTPGIDAAGVVELSESSDFEVGDEVIVTSYDLGMNTSGGLSEYIRVPAHWVVPMPTNLSMRESMINGTAGFTAAMCINSLINNGLDLKSIIFWDTFSTAKYSTTAPQSASTKSFAPPDLSKQMIGFSNIAASKTTSG